MHKVVPIFHPFGVLLTDTPESVIGLVLDYNIYIGYINQELFFTFLVQKFLNTYMKFFNAIKTIKVAKGVCCESCTRCVQYTLSTGSR